VGGAGGMSDGHRSVAGASVGFGAMVIPPSAHTYVYGPASRGRLRNSDTVWSRSRASSDTWDLDKDVTPSASTRPSTRLVEIPRT